MRQHFRKAMNFSFWFQTKHAFYFAFIAYILLANMSRKGLISWFHLTMKLMTLSNLHSLWLIISSTDSGSNVHGILLVFVSNCVCILVKLCLPKSRIEEWLCAQWGMHKPQFLQMSSMAPGEFPAVSRCNGLHTQLAVPRPIIHSYIWHSFLHIIYTWLLLDEFCAVYDTMIAMSKQISFRFCIANKKRLCVPKTTAPIQKKVGTFYKNIHKNWMGSCPYSFWPSTQIAWFKKKKKKIFIQNFMPGRHFKQFRTRQQIKLGMFENCKEIVTLH